MDFGCDRERHRRHVAVFEEDVVGYVSERVSPVVVQGRFIDEGAVNVELQRSVCWPAHQPRRQTVAEIGIRVVGQHALAGRRDVERGVLEDRVRVVVRDRRVVDRQHVDKEGIGDGELVGTSPQIAGVGGRDPDRELVARAGGVEHVVIGGPENPIGACSGGLELADADETRGIDTEVEGQTHRCQARSVRHGRGIGQCGRRGLLVGEDRTERGEVVERLTRDRRRVRDAVELCREPDGRRRVDVARQRDRRGLRGDHCFLVALAINVARLRPEPQRTCLEHGRHERRAVRTDDVDPLAAQEIQFLPLP